MTAASVLDDEAMSILQQSAPTAPEFMSQIILPDGDGKGVSYDPSVHPAQACIVDAVANGATSITIVKPVQDGGSLIAFALMLWRVIGHGQTAILAYPTLTAARDAWTKKIQPMLAAMDKLPQSGGGSGGGSASVVQVPGGGSIILRSAGGRHESGQASATGDILIPDEIDDWPDMRRVKLIEQRITKSPDPLIVYISTVKRDGEGKDGSHILRLHDAGTQTRMEYPCAHCGSFRTLEWEHVNRESRTIACPACGGILTDSQRIAALPLWRRRDGAKTEAFSILWTALDSPFPIVTNGRKRPMIQALCDEYEYAEQQAALGDHSFMRQFHRDRLCRQYRADLNLDDTGHTTIPTRNRLSSLATRSGIVLDVDRREEDGDSVRLAHIPEWAEHLTVAVDVQRGGDKAPGRLYFLALANGNGKRAIVGWGDIKASPKGRQPSREELHLALDRLDGLLRDWSPAAPIVKRGVDVGDRAAELLPWIRARQDWCAIKGTGPIKADLIQGDAPGWIYHRSQGSYVLHMIETLAVCRVVHGDLLTERILIPVGVDRDASLIRHLCATVEMEPEKWSKSSRDRAKHPEWQERDDLLQCTAYARSLAYWWEARQARKLTAKPRRYGAIKSL